MSLKKKSHVYFHLTCQNFNTVDTYFRITDGMKITLSVFLYKSVVLTHQMM
jgi:adenylate cyclase class IV